MAESKEELKSLLIKVKKESEKAGLKLNIKKLISWHPVPSLHGKCAVLSCFSYVQLCATLWTVACQAPLFMGFSRQEY